MYFTSGIPSCQFLLIFSSIYKILSVYFYAFSQYRSFTFFLSSTFFHGNTPKTFLYFPYMDGPSSFDPAQKKQKRLSRLRSDFYPAKQPYRSFSEIGPFKTLIYLSISLLLSPEYLLLPHSRERSHKGYPGICSLPQSSKPGCPDISVP